MIESVENKSVVIVGNGASLLNRKLGSCIDSYDVVVRFNIFKIGKFAPYVGERTSVWFNNRNASSTQVQNLLKSHDFNSIYVHTWYETDSAVKSFKDYLGMIGKTTPVIGVEKHTIDQMRDYLRRKYRLFSTGAIGVWIMLKHYDHVNLVGFDWWNNPEKFHYGDNSQFKGRAGYGHQPQLEKAFFDMLVEEGRVSFINE